MQILRTPDHAADHFLQEDLPEHYTETLMNWLGTSPERSLAAVGSQ